MKLTALLSLTLLASVSLSGVSLSAQDIVAVKADKIVTGGPQGTVENAVILIENGKITTIGANVEVPWNAKVVDAKGKVVVPAYVLAHTAGGMGRGGANENLANVPYLSVQDAIDPSSSFFEDALRNGIGTMHIVPGNRTLLGGSGMIVQPFGKTVEDMTVRTKGGTKLSLEASGGSRMGQIQKMRNALKDALDYRADYERRKDEFAKEKAAGATDKEEFDEKIDELKKPTLDLLDGKVTGYLYVPSAAEVSEVERMVGEHENMKLVLVLGPTCYKAADRIKALGLPVVLEADCLEHTERDEETGDEETVCPAKVFADAGIDFALSIGEGSDADRYPWWQMALAIRHGMDRAAALRAFTTRAAEIAGIASDFGSIEPGKVANLQILTGDPLKATTWVDTVLLEGEVVYERSKDKRLQHLFGSDTGN